MPLHSIIMPLNIIIMLRDSIMVSCGMIILLGGMIIMMSRMLIMFCGMNACAALGRVYTLGPELHKDLSTLHSPVLHLNLTWTWTLLISTRTAPVSTQTDSRSILTASLRLPWPLQALPQPGLTRSGLYKQSHDL